MKRYFPVIVIVLLILADTTYGCTVNIVGQRKAYRASSRVFIGEFLSADGPANVDLPHNLAKNWKVLDRAKFRIERSWKGPKAGETELYFNPICDCPMRTLLPEPGEKLLIFADKDGVVDACDMYVIQLKDNQRRDDLKRIIGRLGSFWFRTWARIYPF